MNKRNKKKRKDPIEHIKKLFLGEKFKMRVGLFGRFPKS